MGDRFETVELMNGMPPKLAQLLEDIANECGLAACKSVAAQLGVNIEIEDE